MRKIDFNSPDKTLQSVTKNIANSFSFSFYLVESRYHKIIRMYRLNFKTLKFSSKKQNEVDLLSLMNDKKSCSLRELGFNYSQKQVSWK